MKRRTIQLYTCGDVPQETLRAIRKQVKREAWKLSPRRFYIPSRALDITGEALYTLKRRIMDNKRRGVFSIIISTFDWAEYHVRLARPHLVLNIDAEGRACGFSQFSGAANESVFDRLRYNTFPLVSRNVTSDFAAALKATLADIYGIVNARKLPLDKQ